MHCSINFFSHFSQRSSPPLRNHISRLACVVWSMHNGNRVISAMLTLHGLTVLRLMRQSDRMRMRHLMETRRRSNTSRNVDVTRLRRRRCLVTKNVDLVGVGVNGSVAARSRFSAAAQREIHWPFCKQIEQTFPLLSLKNRTLTDNSSYDRIE